MQVLLHAVLPQVTPQFADVAIYRWEYNFRASTVMGMVGAGGIGFELMGSLRIMQYQEVAILLVIPGHGHASRRLQWRAAQTFQIGQNMLPKLVITHRVHDEILQLLATLRAGDQPDRQHADARKFCAAVAMLRR